MSSPTITRYLPSYLDPNVHPGIRIPINAMDTCIQNLMRQAGKSNKANVDRNLTGRDIVTLIDGEYAFSMLSDAENHANTVEAISTNMNSQGFEIEKWPLKKLENFLFEMVTRLTKVEANTYRENPSYIRKRQVFADDPAKLMKYIQENDPADHSHSPV